MHIYNNEKMIARRALLGRWGSIGGMGVLLVGLVISFSPQYFYISFACLIVGFMLSQIGTYNAARFSRTPRQYERLERALKGLDNRYVLFNYVLPAAHVLLGPHGLMVFRLKDQTGEIQCTGDRWKQRFSVGRLLGAFAAEGLGNPARDVQDEVKLLQRHLDKLDADLAKLPIEGVVVFLSPAAKLDVTEPTVPVVNAKQIKELVREPSRRRKVRAADRDALLALLKRGIGEATEEEMEEEVEASDEGEK
jgi:hypothetical protein